MIEKSKIKNKDFQDFEGRNQGLNKLEKSEKEEGERRKKLKI